MAKVIAGITLSLDGFIQDARGGVDVLYPDFVELQNSEPLLEAIRDTGAVVMGRGAFAMAEDPDSYADSYEFRAPIFVLTHQPPQKHPKEAGGLTFTFVTDGIQSAIRQAKAAAGDKDVTIVGGASTIRQALDAQLVDELHIDLMPVLLGDGLRLFADGGSEQMQLERLQVTALSGGRTHLRFRVPR